jgi:hypothetical protein
VDPLSARFFKEKISKHLLTRCGLFSKTINFLSPKAVEKPVRKFILSDLEKNDILFYKKLLMNFDESGPSPYIFLETIGGENVRAQQVVFH